MAHRALATTVLLTLLTAISATTFLIPANLAPASLSVPHLNVLLGRSQHDWRAKEREFAFVKFDLKAGECRLGELSGRKMRAHRSSCSSTADLSPLFNWNTKQVFVYLTADYATPEYVCSLPHTRDRHGTS